MAIKKADKSYFFENYDKQAAAVLAALKKQGYAVVPMEPDEKTLYIYCEQSMIIWADLT